MITRRRVVLAFGAGAVVAPLALRAQRQPWTIGLLWTDSVNPSPNAIGLLNALREKGYVLDRDIRIDNKVSLEGYGQMNQGALKLVGNKVDVIVTLGATACIAAAKATKEIPIVGSCSDPVAFGLAKSLARPEGNFTGLSNLTIDLSSKHLQFIRELVPNLKRVGLLLAPESKGFDNVLREITKAAHLLGMQTQVAEVHSPADLDNALASLSNSRLQAMMVPASSMLIAHSARISVLASKYRLPTIYPSTRSVYAGGLISYSADIEEIVRRLAHYVDSILKGAKPAELPIEQPTKFILAINLKTAKALGLNIPQPILVRADRVIE